MTRPDPIIDRSKAQQVLLVKKLRVDLARYGYSIIQTERLKEMLAKLPLVDRLKTMLVD